MISNKYWNICNGVYKLQNFMNFEFVKVLCSVLTVGLSKDI